MNEKQKAKFIYNLILDISGDVVKAESRGHKMAKAYQGKEILLGKVFEKEAASCRHKSILFKILAEEIGLNVNIVRGNLMDMGGIGGHAWNEVVFSNGKKIIFDTQNSAIIALKEGSRNKKAFQYLKTNNDFYYSKL